MERTGGMHYITELKHDPRVLKYYLLVLNDNARFKYEVRCIVDGVK